MTSARADQGTAGGRRRPTARPRSAARRGPAIRRPETADGLQLRLLPTPGGWSLTTLDAETVFEASGPDARHRCLEFARASGVLSIFS